MSHLEDSRTNAAVQLRALIQAMIADPNGPGNHHASLRAVDALNTYYNACMLDIIRKAHDAKQHH